MARTLHKLKEVSARSDKLKPGRHGDGGGLYLNVSATGSKSWVFLWKRDGKAREMGLGSYPAVSLSKARELARQAREDVAAGRDPIAARNKVAEPTFGDATREFLLGYKVGDKLTPGMEKGWRNEKHKQQWRNTLAEYAKPINTMRISTIGTDDVLRCLSPIWTAKPETASRLRGRIERVLDFAKARGWRQGENPAVWRGHLKNFLPARDRDSISHHAAMPYSDVPAFMGQLRGREAMSAVALRFLILTAARAGEVLGATWDEVDLDRAIWTVPADRMKAKREHRVPLSSDALEIVRSLAEARTASPYVFAGMKPNKPLSNMSFAMLMARMNAADATAHGFRSSFRDWAGDATSFPREIAEHALAHNVGDATERAYRRADAIEKRRTMMQAWADYCSRPAGGKVIPFGRSA